MSWTTITEVCGCGARIELIGSDRAFGVGYEAARWRSSHPCPLRPKQPSSTPEEQL